MQRGREGAAPGREEQIIVKDVQGTVVAVGCALSRSAARSVQARITGKPRRFADNSAVLARRVQDENEGSTGVSLSAMAA
jgi:hypothetical protein